MRKYLILICLICSQFALKAQSSNPTLLQQSLYGYTDFSWKLNSVSLPNDSVIDSESEIEIKVDVTNTGQVPGKDVVELYLTAPYYEGEVEKSHVILLDFEKTPLLDVNQTATLTFTVTPYQFASYDAYDDNKNEMTGWELDAGEYQLKFQTDSHSLKEGMENNILTYNVNEDFRYRKDPVSGGRIKNRFTGEDAYGGFSLDGSTIGENGMDCICIFNLCL